MAKQASTGGVRTNRLLRDAATPLLRLNPSGWSRVAERLTHIDEDFLVLRTEEAIVRDASGEITSAPLPNPTNLAEHLKLQALCELPRRDISVAVNLIEEIDQETGQFTGDTAELAIVLDRPEDDIREVLRTINHFHPSGCGFSSLQQALRCQIPELPDDSSGEVARLLLTDYWEMFSGGGRDVLSEISGLGHQAIDLGLDAIRRHMTPYPAERFWGRDGDHLKRGYFHYVEEGGARKINEPYISEYYACLPVGKGHDASRIALTALSVRGDAYAGIGRALNEIDLDDPKAGMSFEMLVEHLELPSWTVWLLTEGELIVDAAGERRYIRELVTIEDELAARVFEELEHEFAQGQAEGDSELAARISRGPNRLDENDVAVLRRELGVGAKRVRCNAIALHLLGYHSLDK